jgi:hypothetical protein
LTSGLLFNISATESESTQKNESKDLCATAQEALDTAEERVIELNKMTFEQQSKELW